MKRRTMVKSLGLAGIVQLSAVAEATERSEPSSFEIAGGWDRRFDSTSITQPTVDTDSLYVGTGDGIASLEKDTGDVAWETSLSGGYTIAPGVVRDGAVVVPTFQSLFRVDSSSGSIEWERHVGTGRNTAPVYADGTAFVANGRDYRDGSAGQLTAIDTSSGDLSWTFEVDGDIKASPSLDGAKLFFGTTNGTVYCVDSATGSQEWEQELDHVVNTTPLVGDSAVYVFDEMGEFYVLDATDGSIRNQRSLSPAWDGFEPVFAGKNVVVAGRDGLYGFNQSGRLKWSAETAAPAMPLYPVDDSVYYGDTDGDVHRVDATSGKKRQLLSFEPYWPGCEDTGYRGIEGRPVVNGGRLYVSLNGGKVASINIQTEE